MRVHYLEHHPAEGVGTIAEWAAERGHSASKTALHAGELPPPLSDFDLLIVMGGPMNIYEEAEHPWLRGEKAFLDSAIAGGKAILGVCLGAQLLADRLGGPVTRNAHREIGWLPIRLTGDGRSEPLFAAMPDGAEVFHWHGDTFALPPGAVRLAESEACANQAFLHGNRVLGLQFHLEFTAALLGDLSALEESWEGLFVQQPETFLERRENFAANRSLLFQLLDALAARV